MKEDYAKMKIAIRYWLLGRGYFKALRAMELAETYHVNTRKDGEPEFSHQISQANFMRAFDGILLYPEQTFCVVFLHDIVEDYDVTYDTILTITDKLTADAVLNISKVIKGVKTPNDIYYSGISKCPITSAAKGADRLHNMMTMVGGFTPAKQISYCAETLTFTVPMLKKAKRQFPEQEVIFENIRYILRNQIILYTELNSNKHEKGFKLTATNDPRCIEYYENGFPERTSVQQEEMLKNWLEKYPPKTMPNYGK